MVEDSGPLLVDGTLRPKQSTHKVWSSVRSCDGGARCGDVAVAWPLSSGRTAIVVIDIAGHGIGRAPLAMALADEIAAALSDDESPATALDRADQLLRAIDDELPYAIAFVAILHPILRTVAYASAGHDVAFTLAKDGSIRHLVPTAPMLGIPLANNACDAVFMLEPTDSLVIVTDGISDSHRAGSSDFFGAARTALAVTRSAVDGTDPSRSILAAACAHEGGVQSDDNAAIVIHLQLDRQQPKAIAVRYPRRRRAESVA